MSVRYAILGCSPVRSVKKDTHTRRVCCLLAAEGARLSVSSLCYHGCVGQEPVAGGDSSVDVFWESW